MIYIVRQKIVGTVEYVVDSESPAKEVVNITDRAEIMNSTLDIEYTDELEIRKINDKDYADPVINAAAGRLKRRLNPPEIPHIVRKKNRTR